MAYSTAITAITASGAEHILLFSESVANLRQSIANALGHQAFQTAEDIYDEDDNRAEFPLAILRDAHIEREIGFVNGVETTGQAIHHIAQAQNELNALIAATSEPVRLFVSIE